MSPGRDRRPSFAAVALAGIVGLLPLSVNAQARVVALPEIANRTVAPRVIYVENPRFPGVSADDLQAVLRAAAVLVARHFAIKLVSPGHIPVRHIDEVFAGLVDYARPAFRSRIGDIRAGKVDWELVRKNLVKEIELQPDPLADQIEFARPYLIHPLDREDLEAFSRAVTSTFQARLSHWTSATLDDGHPVIGKIPGRADLPLNEYMYWALMAKRGIEAEIVLTNQLVASVEYVPTPVHSSIRGGITGGSTDYNPSSRYGTLVWVSLFPFLSDDPQIRELRDGETYAREEALSYAGAMLAHELGHQLLHLGHPWANPACVMRPAQALRFKRWVESFDASACRIGSSPAMTRGTLKVPVW